MYKRVFISIDLPEDVRAYLKNRHRPEIRWVKWMNEQNYHITLNFLGQISDERQQEVLEIITRVSLNHSRFDLKISRGKIERDMYWLVPDPSPPLSAIQEELRQEFREAKIGKRERRRYIPHLLFAKSRTGRYMEELVADLTPQEFTVDAIHLYDSELTPGKATHTLIQSFPLA
jgi:RNA 2',3'-cyclic 3'-phosphodiesterase